MLLNSPGQGLCTFELTSRCLHGNATMQQYRRGCVRPRETETQRTPKLSVGLSASASQGYSSPNPLQR